jgi:hypothetical protein
VRAGGLTLENDLGFRERLDSGYNVMLEDHRQHRQHRQAGVGSSKQQRCQKKKKASFPKHSHFPLHAPRQPYASKNPAVSQGQTALASNILTEPG